jgi:hypothetical protein
MPCSKYKGAQRRLCYATDEWKTKPKKVKKVEDPMKTAGKLVMAGAGIAVMSKFMGALSK